MARSRRHHYIAEFYLRNFTEHLGRNLFVYDRKTQKWDKRTPKGVGWFPHLYSMFNDYGEKTDDFEKFLSHHIETPIAPIMKKAAIMPDALTKEERESVAMFIGITAARTPSMMKGTLDQYFSELPIESIVELDDIVQLWCDITGKIYTENSQKEFFKPSVFGAVLVWAASLRDRLVKWNWTFIRTTINYPFVTSDSPALSQKMGNVRLVTFPISSEIAVIISNVGLRKNIDNVASMNRGTLENAKEFVICHKKCFPGDDFLPNWAKRLT